MGKLIESIGDLVSAEDRADARERLGRIITDFGSHTPDNLSCADNLDVIESEGRVGAGVRSGVLLSSILNVAEGCEVPEEVRRAFPQVDSEAWDAALRLVTLLLCDLEKPVDAEQSDSPA